MSDNPALSQLKKAIINQKSAALPDFPTEPGLQPLHNQIADYDRFVSETVIGILGGGQEAQSYPSLAGVERELDEAPVGDNRSRVLVEQYRNYKNRLDRMLDLAVQVAQERKGA